MLRRARCDCRQNRSTERTVMHEGDGDFLILAGLATAVNMARGFGWFNIRCKERSACPGARISGAARTALK